MRGVGGLLRLTQCLGMLWGQNIAQGYIPPSPTLAGLVAGLPLHRYYNNKNTTTFISDSNVYNGHEVTRQACQTHSSPHSTTHHCNANTTHSTTTTTSDDIMGVGRMRTSALLPSRAAEMTLYDASEGVPLLAVTPCDAVDVQQALCLLTHRVHRRQAQQQQHTSITSGSSSSVCYDDEGGDGEDRCAVRDTLAVLLTTVQTHRTLLAGAESLQTGVPLRFTQRALSSAMAYMAHALHTLSTTTTTITDMKNSDTGITASHASLVDSDIAVRDRAAHMLQQDCHTLREELVQQQQQSLGVHSAWPALCLSSTRFSLAYALQATTAALLTPGCRDVLWLPSADAALAALWLMHLLTHPSQQKQNSTSSSSDSCNDECDRRKKVCKAEGWSAARRFHVLLTGSPSLHLLPALTTLQVSLLHIPTPSLVQKPSAQDDYACQSDTLPTRHDGSTASRICATTTDTTTTTLVSSAHTQPSLLLLLLYGFTPTAAQTLYTELHRKMQYSDGVTHAVPADSPALPVSCHCVTLQPAMPSIVICHTSRVARQTMRTQDDCTAHTVNKDDEGEKKVCAAVARWLYRHAFTLCKDTVRTTTAESETNTRESATTSGAVTDEDVLQLQLSALPAGHGVSCISLTTRGHQTYTTKGKEQTKKKEDERQACSHTTNTTTSSHAQPRLLATVTSSSLRTPLAFIPRSQLRRVLREVVQLYAGGPSVGHISHSLDMECAIGPLRCAAHGEAVRRCLTAAVKGQLAGYEKEEVVVVRERKSSDGVVTTEQRSEGGRRHSASHMASAAPYSSSSVSPHTSPETTCTKHSSSSSTSSPRPESRHAAISSHTTTITTTMNGRTMCMQPVRWQKVSGGFPLSMTAAGPTALYLAPCLLCTSLSALTVSPLSTQAETAYTTSLCTSSSSSGSDGIEMNEADDTEIHALTEAVHRVCHSVARLTAELERDYDGTVPCVLFVCEYEDSSGPAVQRACEQYVRTT